MDTARGSGIMHGQKDVKNNPPKAELSTWGDLEDSPFGDGLKCATHEIPDNVIAHPLNLGRSRATYTEWRETLEVEKPPHLNFVSVGIGFILGVAATLFLTARFSDNLVQQPQVAPKPVESRSAASPSAAIGALPSAPDLFPAPRHDPRF